MNRRVYIPYVLGLDDRPIPYQYENIASRLDGSSFDVSCYAIPRSNRIPAAHVTQIHIPQANKFRKRGKILANSLREYDVLQTGGGPRLRYFVTRTAYLRNRDLTHVHTLHLDIDSDDSRNRYKKKLLSMADIVTAVSHHTAATAAREFDVDPTVIHNGIDTAYFRPDRDPPALLDQLSIDEPVFLYVGKLEPRKRPRDVLTVARAVPDATFLIRGTGSLADQIAPAAADLSNVVMLDRLEKAELARLFATVDGLLFPSVREGCPTVVLEALASGTPVVGYDATSMPELIEDGERGYLCETGDTDALADAVMKLVETDKGEWMSERAREYACKSHSFEQVAAQYQELYMESNVY